MPITIKQPETEKEFEAYYELRWRVLREPWQQPAGSEKDELEIESFHIMASDENNKVVGVGRLHFNTKTEAQIRYMAVAPEYETQGIGTSILEALEAKARQQQYKTIVLHARENVVGFYQKKGYELLEKSHLLFGTIQHFRMCKKIF
ncbi:MAG: GNAT family N-acetyltransferase [Gammaproteobacteria bacterium]|nr:GNAT family N-acetyltransferase [Gammaproteobacteria bacterium]